MDKGGRGSVMGLAQSGEKLNETYKKYQELSEQEVLQGPEKSPF